MGFGLMDEQDERKRVLVVEDDPVTQRIVRTVTEREGYEVVQARDGREAYRALAGEADFAAVILDLMLPHIDGAELLTYMQTEKRLMRIPVIVMTSTDNPAVASQGFTRGAAALLSKPFSSHQLGNLLRLFAGRSSASQPDGARAAKDAADEV